MAPPRLRVAWVARRSVGPMLPRGCETPWLERVNPSARSSSPRVGQHLLRRVNGDHGRMARRSVGTMLPRWRGYTLVERGPSARSSSPRVATLVETGERGIMARRALRGPRVARRPVGPMRVPRWRGYTLGPSARRSSLARTTLVEKGDPSSGSPWSTMGFFVRESMLRVGAVSRGTALSADAPHADRWVVGWRGARSTALRCASGHR